MFGLLSGRVIIFGLITAFIVSSLTYVNYKFNKLKDAESKIELMIEEGESKDIEIYKRDFIINNLNKDLEEYLIQEEEIEIEENIIKDTFVKKHSYNNVFDKIKQMEKNDE